MSIIVIIFLVLVLIAMIMPGKLKWGRLDKFAIMIGLQVLILLVLVYDRLL